MFRKDWKLRMVMLYIITQGGMNKESRKALIEQGQFTQQDED